MSAAETVLGTNELVRLILDELDPEQPLLNLRTVSAAFFWEITRQRWTKHMRLKYVYRWYKRTGKIPPCCSSALQSMEYSSFYDRTVPLFTFPNAKSLTLAGNVHRDLIASIEQCFPRLKTVSWYKNISHLPLDEFFDKLLIRRLTHDHEKMVLFFGVIARKKSIESVSLLIINDSWLQAAIDAGSFSATSFSASVIDTSLTGDTLLKAIPNVTSLDFSVIRPAKLRGLSLAQLTAHKPGFKKLSISIDQPELLDAAQMIKFAKKHCELKHLSLSHAGKEINKSVFDVVDGKTFLEYLPQLTWLEFNYKSYGYMIPKPRYS